jgi:hypothetical protein
VILPRGMCGTHGWPTAGRHQKKPPIAAKRHPTLMLRTGAASSVFLAPVYRAHHPPSVNAPTALSPAQLHSASIGIAPSRLWTAPTLGDASDANEEYPLQSKRPWSSQPCDALGPRSVENRPYKLMRGDPWKSSASQPPTS